MTTAQGNVIDIKRGRKYAQVLDGVRRAFLSDGYEGTSVDDIARLSDVSKATLYSYFPDKQSMFLEFAGEEIRNLTERAASDIDFSQPPEIVLRAAGAEIQNFYLSDLAKNVYRICVAEAARFPELGKRFFEVGMMTAHNVLVLYFTSAVGRGELKIQDSELDIAAYQFAELCRAGVGNRHLFLPDEDIPQDERSRILDAAMKTFMIRFGP